MRKLFSLVTLLAALMMAGCDDGPFEDAGEAVDEAAQDIGNAVEDACEDVKDAANADDKDC